MCSLKILIVLYNKSLNDSESIKTLLNLQRFHGKFELILWDNSLIRLETTEISYLEKKISPSKVNYNHTPENLELSKIYNLVIRDFIFITDYLMLLDDDTTLTEAFFIELFNNLEESHLHADVYLPKILNDGILVSPAKMYSFFGRYYKKINTGFLRSKFIVAINSGMIISGKFLKLTFNGYDERLKFYGTDTYFMKELCKVKGSVYILNSYLNHELSFFKKNIKIEDKVVRLNEMIYGLEILLINKNFIIKFLFLVYKFLLKLKYTCQLKTMKFYDN